MQPGLRGGSASLKDLVTLRGDYFTVCSCLVVLCASLHPDLCSLRSAHCTQLSSLWGGLKTHFVSESYFCTLVCRQWHRVHLRKVVFRAAGCF